MRYLFFRPDAVPHLPREPSVIRLSPLLRELILHACTFPVLRKRVRSQANLIDMILDQLRVVEISPLQLIHPSDPRAARIAEALSKDPGDTRSLEAQSSRCSSYREAERCDVD